MALDVFFTPSAKLDLREARDHYWGQIEELAERFVECAQFAVSRIARSPGQFATVYKNVRQCPLKQFPFVISFREATGRIEILAILHGHRNPMIWKCRGQSSSHQMAS